MNIHKLPGGWLVLLLGYGSLSYKPCIAKINAKGLLLFQVCLKKNSTDFLVSFLDFLYYKCISASSGPMFVIKKRKFIDIGF